MTSRRRSSSSEEITPSKRQQVTQISKESNLLENAYLDTVDRKRLDFDFEKVCSVTLSNVNVYGCLICGKYFQGRGKTSPAFLHSIDEDHHVFINFNNYKTYSLPENTLIESNTLNDIKYAIHPKYEKDDVKRLESLTSVDLNGVEYKPGFIGLNNIKENDYQNVILQILAHTKIIRDVLLLEKDQELLNKNEMNKRLVTFVKKLWSPRLFKNHISPHEILQLVGVLSNKKFTLNEQKNPKDFLVWLLNTLHKSFGAKDSKSTIISKSFQGKLKIQSQKFSTVEGENLQVNFKEIQEHKEISTKFWMLTLDLPPMSFFKSGASAQAIPQVKLTKLLEKFNGSEGHTLPGEIRRYSIEKFPPYLLFHFNRFKDQNLDITLDNKNRNQTIVEFPFEIEFREGQVKYKLISNVVHEVSGQSQSLQVDDKSSWKVQLRRNEDWLEIESLSVREKEKEFLFLSESFIQVWERIK